jgi:uncharacterized protein YjdB
VQNADGQKLGLGDGSGGMSITVNVPSTPVDATGVTLNKGNMQITVGQTETLIPTIQPGNATSQAVNWRSSDASKVVVSSGGVVTAIAHGTAVVAVATVDGGYMDMCTITVSPAPSAPVHPVSVALDVSALTVQVGATAALTPTVLPSNATDRNVYWLTSSPSVAVVSSIGLVTGVAPGTATITVATVDGGKTAACAVAVIPTVHPVSVTLDRHDVSLALDESVTLNAIVLPANAANKYVTWATGSANVATVSQAGIVTATGRGTATITATTVDGGLTDTCNVTVGGGVAVTGLSLSHANLVLGVGGIATLTVTVYPASASNKNVWWSATGNLNCIATSPLTATTVLVTVTALGAGAATIIATTEDGGHAAQCTVSVIDGIRLDNTALGLTVGGVPSHLTAYAWPRAMNENLGTIYLRASCKTWAIFVQCPPPPAHGPRRRLWRKTPPGCA